MHTDLQINAHGPFHRELLKVGVGNFQFVLKFKPVIKVEVEVVLTNRNYLQFGNGWKKFLEESLIDLEDLVHLRLVPEKRCIMVMSFRWEMKGPNRPKKGYNGACLTPMPTPSAHPSSPLAARPSSSSQTV